MSRGLGRLERAIAEHIERDATNLRHHFPAFVTVEDIFEDVFRDPEAYRRYLNRMAQNWDQCPEPEPTAAQRKSIIRAMHSFVRKHQRYALTGGKGRKQLFLYEPDDLLSASYARLKVERRGFVSWSEARAVLAKAEAA